VSFSAGEFFRLELVIARTRVRKSVLEFLEGTHMMQSEQAGPEQSRGKSDRVPDPTPEEIAARCREIQMRWSEEERIGRTHPESTNDHDCESNF
jgi:hypothetical protein